MKNTLLILFGALFLIASCQSEAEDTKNENEDTTDVSETPIDTNDIVSNDNITIFASEDMGVREYLKLVEKENGGEEWYYWTEKKETEVRLGLKDLDGLKGIYFFGKPGEVYEIGGSECGFSLFLGEKRLQWYQQIEPECSMEEFM